MLKACAMIWYLIARDNLYHPVIRKLVARDGRPLCILTEKWQQPYFSGAISKRTGKRNAVTFCHKHFGEAKWQRFWPQEPYFFYRCDLPPLAWLKSKTSWEVGFFQFLSVYVSLLVHEIKLLRKWVLIGRRVFRMDLEMQHFLWRGLS